MTHYPVISFLYSSMTNGESSSRRRTRSTIRANKMLLASIGTFVFSMMILLGPPVGIPTLNIIAASAQTSDSSLVGAFYYPWTGGKNTPSPNQYKHWKDDGHNPPFSWASNYLPDINPTVFDPANELYDSNNPTVVKKQDRKSTR